MNDDKMKIGELASNVPTRPASEAGKIGSQAEKAWASAPPPIEAVEQVIGQVAQFAEKNWPKPPPIRMSPPPLKKKAPLPPPLRPRADFRRD